MNAPTVMEVGTRAKRPTLINCAMCGTGIRRGRKFCAPCSDEHRQRVSNAAQIKRRIRLRRAAAEQGITE